MSDNPKSILELVSPPLEESTGLYFGPPPVGTVCQLYDADGWEDIKILAIDSHGLPVIERFEDDVVERVPNPYELMFRPVPTDRDKWISKAVSVSRDFVGPGQNISWREFCAAIYDAGLAGWPE